MNAINHGWASLWIAVSTAIKLKQKKNYKYILGIEKHTVSNRWALLSNVFLSFSSGKYRTNIAETKQHENIYPCAKDKVTQTTDANVGKGATVRVNIDKEGASGVKKKEIKKLQVTWC